MPLQGAAFLLTARKVMNMSSLSSPEGSLWELVILLIARFSEIGLQAVKCFQLQVAKSS